MIVFTFWLIVTVYLYMLILVKLSQLQVRVPEATKIFDEIFPPEFPFFSRPNSMSLGNKTTFQNTVVFFFSVCFRKPVDSRHRFVVLCYIVLVFVLFELILQASILSILETFNLRVFNTFRLPSTYTTEVYHSRFVHTNVYSAAPCYSNNVQYILR